MFSFVILVASVSATLGAGFDFDSGIERRWRSEYQIAAERWERIERNFWAEGRLSFRFKDGPTAVTNALKVAASDDKKLFIRDQRNYEAGGRPGDRDRPLDTDVNCETNEYIFSLTKPAIASDFVIESYEPFKKDEVSSFLHWFNNFARSATCFLGFSVLQRMQHPSFVLKSIEGLNQDGDELVRISYSHEGAYTLETGFFDLDVGKDWAIRHVEVASRGKQDPTSSPYRYECDVQYKKVDGSHYFPVRKEFYGRTSRAGAYEHLIVELDDVWLGPPPDAMFRLSGYGLPDIPLRPAPRESMFTYSNPLFWLTFAASISSFALLWLLRRREAAMAQAP